MSNSAPPVPISRVPIPHAWNPVPPDLAAHEAAVRRDLALLGLPPAPWTAPRSGPDGNPLLDVVVVGAGVCGLGAAIALMMKGIANIRVLDRSARGREGPWNSFARMKTLRSNKTLTGPAMGIPSLTFRAWYEARCGAAAWEALDRIPNGVWMEYLGWLARVLALPVENETEVTAVEPCGGIIRVRLNARGRASVVHARRVVLATGLLGGGGMHLPDFADRSLWPDRAAHAAEDIDFARLAGRRVVVIGGGPSAWDNAAAAVEAGAARVDMLIRRAALPQVNKGRATASPGFLHGYGALDDAARWRLLHYIADWPAPPTADSIARVHADPRFAVHLATPVETVSRDGAAIRIELAGGRPPFAADFVIFATGFAVGLERRPELAGLVPAIATWGDRYQPPEHLRRAALAAHPYVGPAFELQERVAGACPDLGLVHLFNFAAAASHGPLAGGIPGVVASADRLAVAITTAFFREDIGHAEAMLQAFAEPDLAGTPFHVAPDHVVSGAGAVSETAAD